ncbi:MAG: prolyl oligopeptidase family serine peptidase [Bifidobacteriaceae bacterium]|jgi:dipeptidyl aminopeptidase/acylaminoacyl peptidase|nr:prolyl oligopeptidase family serine peptidase [Bifidobacteriaceae bacterium]
MRPEHLDRLYAVSRPALHPAGWAVVAATRPDFASDAYVGQLWQVPLDGSAPPRRLTRGFRDTAPCVSPDGRLIGFLRAAGPGLPAQLALVEAGGGEPMVVTDQPLGVAEFCFSADSSRLYFTAPVPEPGRYGTPPVLDPAAEAPRHITTLSFQWNGRGYVGDQRLHVFTLTVPDVGGEPPVAPVGRAAAAGSEPARLVPLATQLTDGDADHSQPVAVPGGVVVAAARHPHHDLDLRVDLYRVGDGGGAPVQLTNTAEGLMLRCANPVPVGDDLFFTAWNIGPIGRDLAAVNQAVYRVALGGGEPERLTVPDDIGFESLVAAPGGDPDWPLLGVIGHRGEGLAVQVSREGAIRRLALPEGASALALAGLNGLVAAAVATPGSPGEVARLSGPGPALLTDFAGPLRTAETPVPPVELVATSPDGAQVHGWVFVPPGEGPHPVLLVMHGGPYFAWHPWFFDEAQVYAGAGYAVVMPNPRGSAEYGEAWGKVVKGSMGDRDSVDVLAFLEHALATVPGLDGARLGVMGGSYGGFLSAWLIAHDHRFKGAIVERAYLDPRSANGASDIGWLFGWGYNPADLAELDRQSPTLLVDQVKTPVLVLHSEQDLRCPLAHGLRYYTELKLAGVEAELLVFPGESHELTRSGRPWHRRQRFDAVLDWWARRL